MEDKRFVVYMYQMHIPHPKIYFFQWSQRKVLAVHFLYSLKMSWSSCVGWQLLYNWEISRLEISLISSSSKFWNELISYWWIDYIILATLLLVFASQFLQVPSHMIQECQVYCFLVQPTMHFSSSLTQQNVKLEIHSVVEIR